MYWNVGNYHHVKLWYMGKDETEVREHQVAIGRITASAAGPYEIYTGSIEFNPKVNVSSVSDDNYIISAQYYATNVNTTGETYTFSAPTTDTGEIIIPETPSSNVLVYTNKKWVHARNIYMYKDDSWQVVPNAQVNVYTNGKWKK